MSETNFQVNLKCHKTCIFGIQESGKTYWVKTMYKQFKRPLIYSVNEDDNYEKCKGLYVWRADKNNLTADFDKFIKQARAFAYAGKIDLIIIEEADLFFQTNFDITPEMQDLILNHRHIPPKTGVALWFVTRRPQDIPTKILESSKHLVVFKLEGVNAIKKFSEIHPRIPELIDQLDFTRHNFVFKQLGREPVIHKPLEN